MQRLRRTAGDAPLHEPADHRPGPRGAPGGPVAPVQPVRGDWSPARDPACASLRVRLQRFQGSFDFSRAAAARRGAGRARRPRSPAPPAPRRSPWAASADGRTPPRPRATPSPRPARRPPRGWPPARRPDRLREGHLHARGFGNGPEEQLLGPRDRRRDERRARLERQPPGAALGWPSSSGSRMRVPSGNSASSPPCSRIVRAVSSASSSECPRRTGKAPSRTSSLP